MKNKYKPTKFELETAMKVSDYLNLCQSDHIQFELDKPEYEEDETYTTTMQFPDKQTGENFAKFMCNTVEDTLLEVGDCFNLEGIEFDVNYNTCEVVVTLR